MPTVLNPRVDLDLLHDASILGGGDVDGVRAGGQLSTDSHCVSVSL